MTDVSDTEVEAKAQALFKLDRPPGDWSGFDEGAFLKTLYREKARAELVLQRERQAKELEYYGAITADLDTVSAVLSAVCQSAPDRDPVSAFKRDPLLIGVGRSKPRASAPP